MAVVGRCGSAGRDGRRLTLTGYGDFPLENVRIGAPGRRRIRIGRKTVGQRPAPHWCQLWSFSCSKSAASVARATKKRGGGASNLGVCARWTVYSAWKLRFSPRHYKAGQWGVPLLWPSEEVLAEFASFRRRCNYDLASGNLNCFKSSKPADSAPIAANNSSSVHARPRLLITGQLCGICFSDRRVGPCAASKACRLS